MTRASDRAGGAGGPGADTPTLVALAVVAYAAANVLHEVVGHGGTCLLVGGRLVTVSAIHCECDTGSAGVAARHWVSSAGTLANLLAAAASWALLRNPADRPTAGRYLAWLFMTVNLLQACGYWLFSGLGNVGDWARIVSGFHPRWPWRIALAVAGALGYLSAILRSLRRLDPMLGAGEDRLRRARKLALVPYVTGGILYVAAGLLNPVSPMLVLISAAAASLGGTSGLVWMTELLRGRAFAPEPGPALVIAREPGWIAAGLLAIVAFAGVLGPGLRF